MHYLSVENANSSTAPSFPVASISDVQKSFDIKGKCAILFLKLKKFLSLMNTLDMDLQIAFLRETFKANVTLKWTCSRVCNLVTFHVASLTCHIGAEHARIFNSIFKSSFVPFNTYKSFAKKSYKKSFKNLIRT